MSYDRNTSKPSNQQRLPLYIYGYRRKDNLLIYLTSALAEEYDYGKHKKNLIPPKVNLGKINANTRK